MVAFGGKCRGKEVDTIEYFMANSNQWYPMELRLKKKNCYFSHVQLDDKRVLVIGGHDGKKYLKTVYEINFDKDEIVDYEDLHKERQFQVN